ncbi:MAG: cupin domain-containing protein [Proteobacteria bacterium]|nr:cupin domain-containing protein [Pseudomonadota bacterium]
MKTADAPPPIEVQATAKHLLGMPPQAFLRDYWQKHPLLIRGAFKDFVSPLSPEDLAGLACEEAALARIVEHDRKHDRWTLRHGPFAEADFTKMGARDWTLLVQDVDKWDADVRALLERFDFIPRWRIDDVMVSYAAPGGSVGAHVDHYDVFLLQGMGARRWQVDAGPNSSTAFRDDVELKLLRTFHPTHTWTLEAGDMLYLPPGVPHHGVAADACLTFSVGMRAPAQAELMTDYADHLASTIDEASRYADPDLALPADAHEIDAAALARVRRALAALQADDATLAAWFGGFISQYRSVGIAPPPKAPTDAAVRKALAGGGELARHPFLRMAWTHQGQHALLFASGNGFPMPATSARTLAAIDRIDATAFASMHAHAQDAVLALVRSGGFALRPAKKRR